MKDFHNLHLADSAGARDVQQLYAIHKFHYIYSWVEHEADFCNPCLADGAGAYGAQQMYAIQYLCYTLLENGTHASQWTFQMKRKTHLVLPPKAEESSLQYAAPSNYKVSGQSVRSVDTCT